MVVEAGGASRRDRPRAPVPLWAQLFQTASFSTLSGPELTLLCIARREKASTTSALEASRG